MVDHSIMQGFKFRFGGCDYLPLIREQVEVTRNKFGALFGIEKIPLMDEKHRLYYINKGVEQEIVRVGGGYQHENVKEGEASPSAKKRAEVVKSGMSMRGSSPSQRSLSRMSSSPSVK